MPTRTPPPHIRAKGTVGSLMWATILALSPTIAALTILFGFDAFRVFVVSAAAALLTEMGMRSLFRARASLYDGSSVLSALLFAALLPWDMASWKVALGSAFALAMGKEIFGGLGQSFFHPALIGRAFLFACFPSSFSSFPVFLEGPRLAFLAFAVAGGGISLLSLRLVDWEMPLLYLGGLGFLLAFPLARSTAAPFLWSTLLFAFFILTDPVTTPLTRPGKRWFAFGAFFFTALFGLKADAVSASTYAILLMDALTPWIDHCVRPMAARRICV